MAKREEQRPVSRRAKSRPPLWLRLLLSGLLVVVFAGIGLAVMSLPDYAPGLEAEAATAVDRSGVSHVVTAVLLNFRGYDTLLEMAVLLLATIGVWSLRSASPRPAPAPGPVLEHLNRLITPLMILVAGYLLWAGSSRPGGAFQAGAVLGAAGVLLQLTGWRLPLGLTGWPLRLALILGVAVFAGVGSGVMWTGASLLEYPLPWAGKLILIIEVAGTLSIGVTLAALFLGGRPVEGR